MGEQKTMVQTAISLGDAHYLLSQGHDSQELKQQIEDAIHSGGAFVDFIVVGNRRVSAFLDGRERIVLTVETVLFDERDTGDVDTPFGGTYDMDGSSFGDSHHIDPL